MCRHSDQAHSNAQLKSKFVQMTCTSTFNPIPNLKNKTIEITFNKTGWFLTALVFQSSIFKVSLLCSQHPDVKVISRVYICGPALLALCTLHQVEHFHNVPSRLPSCSKSPIPTDPGTCLCSCPWPLNVLCLNLPPKPCVSPTLLFLLPVSCVLPNVCLDWIGSFWTHGFLGQLRDHQQELCLRPQ